MKFKINPIKPSMTQEERIYEYARRISYYSLLASREKFLSKRFNCQNIERNFKLVNEKCGCFKHGIADTEDVCEPCLISHGHYLEYRNAVSKKAAALRQLNNQMSVENSQYPELEKNND